MTILDMVKNDSRFKSYCRRRSTAPRLSSAQRFKAAQRKFQSEFRSFCRRRGALSILKENEYETGRVYVVDGYEYPERAVIKRINGEFVSEIINAPEIKKCCGCGMSKSEGHAEDCGHIDCAPEMEDSHCFVKAA